MHLWHERYLALANHVAGWSKDPKNQVGAVIVRDNKILATGFNGYPSGVPDIHLDDRIYKNARTIHAEVNAIIQAEQNLKGSVAYVSHHPCSHCTGALLQAGVEHIFYNTDNDDRLSNWKDSIAVAKDMALGKLIGFSLSNPNKHDPSIYDSLYQSNWQYEEEL